MSEISIPSTGNAAEDQRRLERFARNDELIQANQCPNGCGEMLKGHNRAECTECGFIYTVSQISL